MTIRQMALFPTNSEVLFVQEDLWVPVVRCNGNVCIFPGIPTVSLYYFHALTSIADADAPAV